MHLFLNNGCIDLTYTTIDLLLNSRCIDAIIHLLFNNRMTALLNSRCIDDASMHLLSNSRCINDVSTNTSMQLLLHRRCIEDASTIVDASTMYLLHSCYIYNLIIEAST